MLTERQLMILNQIIKHYIEYGEPMGSKTLLSETNLSVSPATIRNEMMRIEELGFLKKTHASSGRIPSILGYRHYVDYLLQQGLDNSSEEKMRKKIQQSIHSPYQEAQEMIEKSARMLSYLTNYTALSIGPEKINSKLTGFRLVPVTSGQYMAILVTDKGYIESKMFSLGRNFDSSKLEKIVTIFNDELTGLALSEVYKKLQTDIPALITKYVDYELDLFAIFKDIISRMDNDRVYVGGEMNLLNYFDFDQLQDREKVKSLYSLIHESSELRPLLLTDSNRISVRIGTEMNNELLDNLSIITATYSAGKRGTGMIALLGPTNMPYDEIIRIMRVTSDELSDSMQQFYEE